MQFFKQLVSKFLLFIVLAAFSPMVSRLSAEQGTDLARLVDPKIGTEGSGLGCGFTFLGATMPFGMVQFTPTFFAPQRGFVVNQLSGAGCPQLGNFPVLPVAGELTQSPKDMEGFERPELLVAHAGFISMKTKDQVICNGTVTHRTAVAEFEYPTEANSGTVLIGSGCIATQPTFYNSHVRITSPRTVEGYAQGGDFCGHLDTKHMVFFAAEFNRPSKKAGTWKDNDVIQGQMAVGGANSGAYFTFDASKDKKIYYKISISYVSIENARENLAKDDNKGSFQALVTRAESEWNRCLSKVRVSREDPEREIQHYTHLYHSLIHPNLFSDINGEYRGADFAVHKVRPGHDAYTSFSGWDTYRSQCQLVAMLFPREASDMMQSAIDFASQAGGFGRWILANIETGVMQGDPMPMIISSTHAFGATDFDKMSAFKYMKLGAMTPGLRSQTVVVRDSLEHYLAKGYTGSASETLEYASADFAIGRFALDALNDKKEAEYFINRSRNWKKLWDPSTGWLRSRDPGTGEWKDPNNGWREATKKNYFWMVPFDLNGLVETTLGAEKIDQRLDEFFVKLDANYHQDWFAGGNEPNFQAPWTYNWIGKPYKTTALMHRLFTELYKITPSGCPGNDDLGAMGSFYVFGQLGLYPMIPGVAGFAMHKPQFEEIDITLPEGVVSIRCKGNGLNIESVKVNERPHDSSWLGWDQLRHGARLEYTTTDNPAPEWATKSKLPSFDGF